MNKKLTFLLVMIIILAIFTVSFFYLNNYKNKTSNEDAAVDLYKDLIDLALSSNGSISDETKFISIDVNKFVDPLNGKNISLNAKQEILNYCKKYNKTIYDKNYQELFDTNAINLENQHGYLIKINMTSKNKNKIILNVMRYSERLSSNMSQYIIEYINESWKYTDNGIKIQD